MLILKPNCEFCDKDLESDSLEARICSYECTFCASCVEDVLLNVCPNCGGGFCQRPIRPKQAYRDGVSRVDHPSSSDRVHTPYSESDIRDFANDIKNIAPHQR